jgi:hypothetical protein
MLKYLVFVLLFSCSFSDDNAEKVLTTYVNARFEGKTVDDVKDSLTEDFYKSVQDAGSEEREKIWILDNLKLKTFKVLSSNCSEENCQITYYISYYTHSNGKNDFLTETKKIAEMKKVNNLWKIAGVTHIKTFHDSLNDIEVKKTE